MEKPLHTIRLAEDTDLPEMRELIGRSVRQLQTGDYSLEQREAALATIFQIDEWLIRDRTYFLAECEGRLSGIGAWSGRCASFEANANECPPLLDAATQPARIRAFFIDPSFARQGIGSLLLRHCEEALLAAGFRSAFIIATLTGESLYTKHGYVVRERYELPIQPGISFPVVSLSKAFLTRNNPLSAPA
jgi:GNAT superfamily N-acetyltransferase